MTEIIERLFWIIRDDTALLQGVYGELSSVLVYFLVFCVGYLFACIDLSYDRRLSIIFGEPRLDLNSFCCVYCVVFDSCALSFFPPPFCIFRIVN